MREQILVVENRLKVTAGAPNAFLATILRQ
jgi:hypothetical protein